MITLLIIGSCLIQVQIPISTRRSKLNIILLGKTPFLDRENPKYDLKILCKKNHPKLIEWLVILNDFILFYYHSFSINSFSINIQRIQIYSRSHS